MENKIVSRNEWLQQRLDLLEKEKEFTRLRDTLSQSRRDLPWVKVEKAYQFQATLGVSKLSDLFEENSQLIVYHFMLGPESSQGCKMCSFWADHFNALVPHLNQRDTTLVCISRGHLDDILAFKKRMGWTFKWYSSQNSDFNFDFHATMKGGEKNEYNYRELTADKSFEMPGVSVFYRNGKGDIFHTYSCYARELETFNTAYRFLDIVPKGRNEIDGGMSWVQYHDNY